MINEHHCTPSCSDVCAIMTARRSWPGPPKRAKIADPGQHPADPGQPGQVAEQIAMADLISGGRIISGFVRGVGVETWWANSNPVHNRERFEECHDLIIKCWTEPGPVPLGGQALPLPARQPVVPAAAEAAPADLGAGHGQPRDGAVGRAHGATPTCPFLVPFQIARELFDFYRQGAAEAGREVTAGQARLPDLRRRRRHQGQGARGRPPLRVADGADPARPGRVLRPAGHALARRRAGSRSGRAPGLAVDDDLRGAGRRTTSSWPARRTRWPTASRTSTASSGSATCCSRPRSRAWTTPTTMRSIELIGKSVIPAMAGL